MSGNVPLTFRLQVQGDSEIVSKFNQVGTAMKQISPTATQMQGSINKAGTSFRNTGNEAAASTTKFNSFSGALQGMSTKIDTVGISTNGLTGSLQNVGRQTQNNVARNQQYSGALQGMRTDTQAASSQTDTFTGALGSFTKENTRAKGGLDATNTVVRSSITPMGKLGTETDKTKSKMGGFAEAFRGNRGLIFSLSMVTSGLFEAQGMIGLFTSMQEKQQKAQARVNELTAEGVTSGREYQLAQNDLADANRGLQFAQRNTILSMSDMIPLSIMLGSSLIDLAGKGGGIKSVFGGIASKATGLGGALKTIPGHIVAITTAMSALTLRHPWILAITAATAAVIALATNVGGARDKVNNMVDSFTTGVPAIDGFVDHWSKGMNNVLDWVDQGIQGLTGASNTSTQTAEAMASDADKIGLQWIDTGETIKFGSIVIQGSQADIGKAYEKTRDISAFSTTDQISFLQELEKENQDTTATALALLQKREQSEEDTARKYHQYALARRADDQAALEQLDLTAKEEEEFNKRFIEGNQQAAEVAKKANEDIMNSDKERSNQKRLTLAEELKLLEQQRTSNEETAISLKAHWIDSQITEAEFAKKHHQFVLGYIQGDDDIRANLKMTSAELQQHQQVWDQGMAEVAKRAEEAQKKVVEATKARVKEFTEAWKQGVENTKKSFDTFRDLGVSTLLDVGGKLQEIAAKATEAQNEYINGEGKRSERKKEFHETMMALYDEETAVIGTLGVAAAKTANKFKEFHDLATNAIKSFAAVALTGDFPQAIANIEVALDKAPPKWKGASGQLQQVLDNTALTTEDKSHLIAANMDMLTNAFEPVQVGAEFVAQAGAQAAAGLDELAAAALDTVNPMTNMDLAWRGFVGALSEDQQQLGLVQAVIKGVESGTISAAKGFQILEAAGVQASNQLGETVTTSLQNLEHQIINLGNGTQATVAKIDGQWVSLGNSTASNLGPSGAQGNVMQLENEMTNLGNTANSELGSKVPGALTTTGTTANTQGNKVVDAANMIIDIFKVVSNYAKTYLQDGVGRAAEGMAQAMSSASNKVSSFGNAAQSAFNKVNNSAKAAERSVRQLQQAINSLKSKTVHIGVSGPGARFLQHGGAFISGMQHGGAFIGHGQKGFSGVVDRPTTFRGVRMGEGFNPELVTVQPLTRGTGNHTGPTVSSTGGVGAGSGGKSITNVINVILDGRKIQTFIEKKALDSFSLQV